MALDYFHTNASQHTDIVARLWFAHRRVCDLGVLLCLLYAWRHVTFLIQLGNPTAVRAWFFLLPTGRSAILRGPSVRVCHHRLRLLIFHQWSLSGGHLRILFVVWDKHRSIVLHWACIEWEQSLVFLLRKVCCLHLEKWRLVDTVIWIYGSQIAMIIMYLLDHLRILIDYLRSSIASDSLCVVLFTEDGSHSWRQFFRTSWLSNAFLDTHVGEVVLRYNLMHLRRYRL